MFKKIMIKIFIIILLISCKTINSDKNNVNNGEENTNIEKSESKKEIKDEPKFIYEDIVVFERDNPNGININFLNNSESVDIFYKIDNSGDFIQKSMVKKDKYWIINIKAKALEFYFKDNNQNIYNLGGTMGSYPYDPSENFKTTYENIWITNNIMLPYDPLKRPKDYLFIMTINLHTYQEKNQEEKFNAIANAIYELKPDVVVMQECAQHKDSEVEKEDHYGKVIKKDNMAKIISDKLKDKKSPEYNYYWDWSHYGWNVWEEGLAIMTRHKILKTDSRYVTNNNTKTYWKSRNIIMTKLLIENIGNINIFSIHAGWWDDKPDPFQIQFERISEWEKEEFKDVIGSFLAGDFNIESGSKGYKYIEDYNNYIDLYRKSTPHGFYDPTIGGKIDGWEKGMPTGKRIDYIFMNKESRFEVLTSQRIFTEKVYGRVSDHTGVIAILRKK